MNEVLLTCSKGEWNECVCYMIIFQAMKTLCLLQLRQLRLHECGFGVTWLWMTIYYCTDHNLHLALLWKFTKSLGLVYQWRLDSRNSFDLIMFSTETYCCSKYYLKITFYDKEVFWIYCSFYYKGTLTRFFNFRRGAKVCANTNRKRLM